MSHETIFPVPSEWGRNAWIDAGAYRREYLRSIEDPDGFWSEHANRLEWFRVPKKVRDCSFEPDRVHIKWFYDGKLNAAYNCLDRHLPQRANQTTILWEG